MDIRIIKATLGGQVRAAASKSQAHRLLICAALSDSNTRIICPERSADIDATTACLNALGAAITYAGDGFDVKPIDIGCHRGGNRLDCGESGSTLRFLLPLACALGADAAFYMSGGLPNRPLSPLYEELLAHGCRMSAQGSVPLKVAGSLKNGNFTLPGNVSSQFISGLLFSLPLLSGDSSIMVTGVTESGPYIDMTVSALKTFGVDIIRCEGNFYIKGNQAYRSPGTVNTEGDWSNAAFWLCAGAIGAGRGSITCTNLNPDSLQGDKAVTDILERFGARIIYGEDRVTVSPGELRGIEIDAGDIPDLVPVLAAVASVSAGKTVIKNAGRLRIKESDRLRATAGLLSGLGADVTETQSGLEIYGKMHLAGGAADSCNDHRIAMTAAVLSSVCENPVTIASADAVNKSYPGFFRDFAVLGGIYEEVI
ncbi:MAG: 3-phosphoshikimate 1-carboxyvinyltransferase [Oscillospiraceae bacterium]